LLSFVYVGIYWGNHHHLLHSLKNISSAIIWANLSLLFCLSLIPFATGWMGENHFAANTVFLYGVLLLSCSVTFFILQKAVEKNKRDIAQLKTALNSLDKKGIGSTIGYICALPLAYVSPIISGVIFVAIAIVWLVPDKNIERALMEVFLIYNLGYIGPEIFYLLAINILVALIFPIAYAYWSILVNTIILLVFAILIELKISECPLANEYKAGQWIAFSSNLVFIGLVMVLLIDKIFGSLQITIQKKDMLRENYRRIFDNSPIPMWVFDTETMKFLTVNEAAIDHYGFTKAEFLGMTILDTRPKDYNKKI
jgi:uncharacterized membrane protein